MSGVTSAGILAPVAQALIDLEAERDRYRSALKSIVLGHKQCGCGEVWRIADEALRPVQSPEPAPLPGGGPETAEEMIARGAAAAALADTAREETPSGAEGSP